MDKADFEKELTACKETMERLSSESKEISDRICKLLEEYDGEAGETYWSCRTMKTDVDDVLSDVDRRLKRFQAGDLRELPQVLILAIECCERLHDTAELCRGGRQDERRDLKGQISSNLGYLAQHLESMREDEYLPQDAPAFTELMDISKRAIEGTAETEELVEFICGSMDPVHEYLNGLRKNGFWEEEKE